MEDSQQPGTSILVMYAPASNNVLGSLIPLLAYTVPLSHSGVLIDPRILQNLPPTLCQATGTPISKNVMSFLTPVATNFGQFLFKCIPITYMYEQNG